VGFFDLVARHQPDGRIALAQLLQLLLDVGKPAGHCRIVAFVYDDATKEVLQVEEMRVQ